MQQSVRYLPVGWFGLAMGLCGIALALRSATVSVGAPSAPGEFVALLALGFEALLVAVYVVRCLAHRDAVLAEFANPATLGFTATLPVSLLLAAGCLAPWSGSGAAMLWWAGAVLFALYQVYALSRWLRGGFEASQVNGGWLIIVLGGLIAPLAGLPLGLGGPAKLLFAVSMLLSPFLVMLLVWRVMMGPPMPDALRPTLFILLVPPSIVYQFYPAVTGESPWWAQACLPLAVALAFALVLASRGALRWPFGPAWGAFTFPLDALCTAAMRNAALTTSSLATLLAWITLALAAGTVALVLGRMLGALARGTLCAPPTPVATGGGGGPR